MKIIAENWGTIFFLLLRQKLMILFHIPKRTLTSGTDFNGNSWSIFRTESFSW